MNHIIVTKDGSSAGFSATIHLASKHKTEDKFSCKITRAISRVKIAAAATTELMAYPLAMGLLGSFLEATYFAWADYKEKYNVFVMGDAKSALFSLGTHPKSIIARSTRSKVLEQARSLSAKYPKIKINFGYLPSQELPADLNSKIHSDLINKMNCSLWREGPQVFRKEQVLLQQVFIRYNQETRDLEIIQPMPNNLPVVDSKGPETNQIMKTIQKQVFSTNITTSGDVEQDNERNAERKQETVEEDSQRTKNALKNDAAEEDIPKQNWLDKEEKTTQLTTLSQATLLSHNIGVCDIVQADGTQCNIPISG